MSLELARIGFRYCFSAFDLLSISILDSNSHSISTFNVFVAVQMIFALEPFVKLAKPQKYILQNINTKWLNVLHSANWPSQVEWCAHRRKGENGEEEEEEGGRRSNNNK